MNSCICPYELAPATMPRIAYSNTVAKSNRLPSARLWSGIVRKISKSDICIRQPLIRVVAYRFRHFRSRESQIEPNNVRELNSPGDFPSCATFFVPQFLFFQRLEKTWRARAITKVSRKASNRSARTFEQAIKC